MARPLLDTGRPTYGKTVGQAMLKSFLHDYRNSRNPGFKPLYTQAAFDDMVARLKSEREYTVYLTYVSLHNGLVEELVRSQAYAQQAQHGLLHLQTTLDDVRRGQLLRDMLGGEEVSPALASRLEDLFLDLDGLVATPGLEEAVLGYYDALLLPALRGLSAYNTLVALLAEAFVFSDLLQLTLDLSFLAQEIAVYNADIDTTASLFASGARQDALPRLTSLFRPVSLDMAKPQQAQVQAVRETLAGAEGRQGGFVQQQLLRLLEPAP